MMSSVKHDDLAHLKIPLEEVKLATNNFAAENVIGVADFGMAYKGQLFWSGELIIIQVQRWGREWGENEQMFWMEISMRSTLKHKNLVSLLGFCDDENERIIITKYEMRGSLENYLSDTMMLTWVRRLEICVGVAHALSYIRYFNVVHRNINSKTILLDSNWEPKLSEFSHSMKMKIEVQDMEGYTEPTYIESQSVSHKSDIYSFGVVMFELLCGRKAVINDDRDNRYLAPLAITRYIEKRLDEIIHRDLRKEIDPESLEVFAETAYACLSEERSQRPNVDEIVTRLEKALELALANKHREDDEPELDRGDLQKLKMKQSVSIVEENPNETKTTIVRRMPNQPKMDLLKGPRKDYLKIGVPLYEASVKCDWKAAKDIFANNPELVTCSLTERGETALHIAASAKVPGKVKDFVKNLVNLMTEDDLALENESYNTALYLAAIAGNIDTVEIMLNKNPSLLEIIGGGTTDTQPTLMPICVAALFGNHNVVKYMYEKSNDLIDEPWTDQTRGWLLEKCAENNMFDVALKIVEKNPSLNTSNVLGILAQNPEAFRETNSNIIQRTISWGKNIHFKKNLTHQPSPNVNGSVPEDLDSMAETKSSIIGRTIRYAKHLYPSSIIRTIKSGTHCCCCSIIGRTIKAGRDCCCCSIIGKTIKSVIGYITSKVVPPEKENEAFQLLRFIWNGIAERPKHEIDDIIRGPGVEEHSETAATTSREPNTRRYLYPSRKLFIAAEVGNTKFVVEIIRNYPDLLWNLNDDHQSIFHIAVKHRHAGIYNLLYEIGAMKDMIIPIIDVHGNNLLHFVGKIATKERLQDVSGVVVLQMQRELLWLKEVEATVPLSLRKQKNKDGQTPYDLFTEEHKDLVTLGEKWIKETANQCMVVAALIATIVFAAAFTVPGGYDQTHGIPFFQSKATFIVFIVADAVSLFSSTMSILIFLSILTSRYAERDFLESLPKKLIAGLATLFLSITTMTVAFSVSFFVLYHNGSIWIPSLIGAFAVMPVFLFIRLQYDLFFDVIRSIIGSRHLFKPDKHVLYYENPKV